MCSSNKSMSCSNKSQKAIFRLFIKPVGWNKWSFLRETVCNTCLAICYFLTKKLIIDQHVKRHTLTKARYRSCVHSAVFEHLQKLAPKRRNVLFDLIHIVFSYTLIVCLTLLCGHVSSYQIPHDILWKASKDDNECWSLNTMSIQWTNIYLITEVALAHLLGLSL